MVSMYFYWCNCVGKRLLCMRHQIIVERFTKYHCKKYFCHVITCLWFILISQCINSLLCMNLTTVGNAQHNTSVIKLTYILTYINNSNCKHVHSFVLLSLNEVLIEEKLYYYFHDTFDPPESKSFQREVFNPDDINKNWFDWSIICTHNGLWSFSVTIDSKKVLREDRNKHLKTSTTKGNKYMHRDII